MMQLQKAGSVVEALKVMAQASSIYSAGAAKLTALVQTVDSAKSEQELFDVVNYGMVSHPMMSRCFHKTSCGEQCSRSSLGQLTARGRLMACLRREGW